MANKLDFSIYVPRLANQQNFRTNFPASNAKEYYRKAIYIPLLDNIIAGQQTNKWDLQSLEEVCRFFRENNGLLGLLSWKSTLTQ